MIPVENTPGIGGEGDEGEWLRRWIYVWYISYIVKTCVNAQCTTTHQTKKEKKTIKVERRKKRRWTNLGYNIYIYIIYVHVHI
jgi:hypothetical protein